jgi:outer membrane protein OmpA-like peptidoglycan-associated protein
MKPFLCIALFGVLACAQDTPQDAEGCTDSPLVARFPGSHINSCDHKEFQAADIPVKKDADGNPVTKSIEGEYYYYDIGVRDGLSALQLFRNFQTALQKAGYTFDYASSPDALTVHKGPQYIYMQFSDTVYYLTTVKQQELKQEATATAAAMGSEIDQSGHVAVYGIHFDTGKATILPDSEPILAQIKQLLEQRPDLKLRVEGHTDNVGSRAANQKLSDQRAAAVVSWLVAHGVDKSRLAAQGFADTKPVGDNSSEEGRAQNRRVELVKR